MDNAELAKIIKEAHGASQPEEGYVHLDPDLLFTKMAEHIARRHNLVKKELWKCFSGTLVCRGYGTGHQSSTIQCYSEEDAQKLLPILNEVEMTGNVPTWTWSDTDKRSVGRKVVCCAFGDVVVDVVYHGQHIISDVFDAFERAKDFEERRRRMNNTVC